ncbi:hypothetical protein ELI02_30180 (plasmid) [Rhizobium leguminosarum]|uniref:hypothetical protein n=1 Tax=Rhizobium leguminosarum TaxID=384 RepID=UPI00102F97EE|nr:hypothetical protein [Rhizobium leguminosarum]TAX45978.1 hypothetical protein ELI02_30180 [Rhizobium leguminosarum]
MGDSNQRGGGPFGGHPYNMFQPDRATELEHQRRQEQHAAEAQAFHAIAYREMPEDLRVSARSWGVEAIMDAVWMNAWECGYKQAMRDAIDARKGER